MEKSKLKCLGLIMDGNRRWAKEQGLETFEGHKKGGEVFADSIDWVKEAGIEHAIYYAFSTENWKRSKSEVEYLMSLFLDWIEKSAEKEVVVKFIGQREDFSKDMQAKMNEVEESTKQFENNNVTIWVALSYGGRAEIIYAVNKAIKEGLAVTEESFSRLLWTADMPDPDMVVRTSGEERLSNFLTWQSVYSELYFIKKHWPALTKDDFIDILNEYEGRTRRHGT